MALSTVADALTQYNANPPSTWDTRSNALACLDAVYFLLANRAVEKSDQGSSLKYGEFESAKTTLETLLGIGIPRANGRTRRVTAAFSATDGIQ